MKVEDLRIFLATAQTGNLTHAADKLLLSKQHVSRRIEALEQQLGVSLFVRKSRGLRITDRGREFQLHASRILEAVESAEQAMSAHCDTVQGTLKITVPLSFGVRYLSPLMAAFIGQHPKVRMQITVSDLFTDLIEGDFDVAVRIGRLPDSALIARKLGDMPMAACCSPAYAARCGVPATPDDLSAHACLLYGKEPQTGWAFTVEGRSVIATVDGPIVSNNGDFILDAATAGCGIAFLPLFFAEHGLQTGRLIRVLDAYHAAPLQVSIVYPQHRKGSPLIDAFLRFIRDNLPRLPLQNNDWSDGIPA